MRCIPAAQENGHVRETRDRIHCIFAGFSRPCDIGGETFRQHKAVFIHRDRAPAIGCASDVAGFVKVQGGEQVTAVTTRIPSGPDISLSFNRYRIRLAETTAEREAACRLRFEVFNAELGEGLADSRHTGMDQDPFDFFCDHLIVEHGEAVVGTYRMQPGSTAVQHLGYYSEQEFDFAPYSGLRNEVLELGRAAIALKHRSSEVLTLLWRGIAAYARHYRLRYLIGCSSLNSRDLKEGWSVYRQLTPFLVPEELMTRPNPAYELEPAEMETAAKVPKLLRTYIAVGARICATPAWDREFGTIDFLTLLDLAHLSPVARSRFLVEREGSSMPAEPVCAC